MQLTFTEEQTALREALERLVGDAARAKASEDALWRALADAEWLGLAVPETHGGFGGSAVEAGLLARALGYHGLLTPFISSILLGANSLACAPAEICSGVMQSVLQGKTRLALAHQEGDRFDPRPPATRARRSRGGWLIEGNKRASLGAGLADYLLVSATVEEADVALFMLPRGHAGVQTRHYLGVDGQQACDVRLSATVAEETLLTRDAGLAERLDSVLDGAIAALCWDAAGAMQALLEQTRDYTGVRKQFGRAISEFQVVQHRLAEMAVCCQEAQAGAELAALQHRQNASVRRRAVSAAKLRVGTAARFVAHEAVQLHGAVGTTEEIAVAGYFRRLAAFQTTLGSARAHAVRYAAAVLPERAHAASAVLPRSAQEVSRA